MKKFLRVLFIICILAFFCYTIPSCNRFVFGETTIVQATVINKEYIESYRDYGYHFNIIKGKRCLGFRHFPEQYNITVQYKDLVEICDSKDLYETVNLGDTIDVELTTFFDFKGGIESQNIHLIN